ncbi:MAG: type I-E CRISPR-associated protein Cas6/Cse3/CasE [Thermodesulfobacteriota bacterium]
MYFTRLRLRPGLERHPVFRRALGESYETHRLIWTLFGDRPDRDRDFLYRRELNGWGATFYLVSARKPEDPDSLWDMEPKPYRPRLSAGQTLFFSLRANPVRSKRDENGRLHRHDVVMEAKHKLKQEKRPRETWPSQAELIQAAGKSWLAARAARHGFTVDPALIRADAYQPPDPGGRGKGREVRHAVMDLSGLLRVSDPDLFLETLYRGLGPAKAFGCGLMLVRRP